MVTSGTSSILVSVCFTEPSRSRLEGEKTRIGGCVENKLKNENGLKLTAPSLLTVDAKQIGRGATAC